MSAILLVWQILLVSLSLFCFPEERRGLDVASAVCCRDLASAAADLGLARLAGILVGSLAHSKCRRVSGGARGACTLQIR